MERYKTTIGLTSVEQGDTRLGLKVLGMLLKDWCVDLAVCAAEKYVLAVRVVDIHVQVVYAVVSVRTSMGKVSLVPSILSNTTARPFMPTSTKSKRALS